jgi:DNA-binding protein YbaB
MLHLQVLILVALVHHITGFAFVPFYAPPSLMTSHYSPVAARRAPSSSSSPSRATLHMRPPSSTLSEADYEEQAKAMGMDVAQYKLVMSMREKVAEELTDHRSTGRNEDNTISVTYDGQMNPVAVKVESDEVEKATLQKELLFAWRDATEGAQMEAQKVFQRMQGEIIKEMQNMKK